MPRPDESCKGFVDGVSEWINSDFERTCRYHYEVEGQARCQIFDKIKEIRDGDKPLKIILDKYGLLILRTFFQCCAPATKKVVAPPYEEKCVKCADCCKSIEMQPEVGFFVERRDPKTKKKGIMCPYLTYEKTFDDGVTDHGYRCELYESEKRPIECINFPRGHESILFAQWVNDQAELRLTHLPLCPASFVRKI